MIRLSRLSDYAIVVMSCLAHAARDAGDTGDAKGSDRSRWTSAFIAAKTRLSSATVAKLIGLLTRAHLLQATRGVGGGVRLARSPDRISLVDIVEAVDGPITLAHCLHEHEGVEACAIAAQCTVKPHWPGVNARVRAALEGISLAVILQDDVRDPDNALANASANASDGPHATHKISSGSFQESRYHG